MRTQWSSFRQRHRWLVRIVGGTVTLAVLVYVGLIAWLMWHETALIFQPQREMTAVALWVGITPTRVERHDAHGAPTLAWEFPPALPSTLGGGTDGHDSSCWALYFHGNNANLSSRGNVTRYHQLGNLGLGVFAPEYPGFSDLPGVPSEQASLDAGREAYAYLRAVKKVPADHIIIYGWSLGSGVAIPVASEVKEGALIVEGAFTSVMRRAQAMYPYLPITWMVHNPFLSEDHMGDVHAPVLFLHSPEDRVVPFTDGQKLYQLARGPKQFVELHGGHVTPNLQDEDHYLEGISTFLRAHTGCQVQDPPRSIGRTLDTLIRERGLDAALAEYRRIASGADRSRYNLADYEFTYLASQLAAGGHLREALAVRALVKESHK
jgi:fermentation-respiration switch protein FrsA (DUF1100 family)